MKIKTHQGFSMIEAMVALGLLSLLVSLAMPSYSDYVIRTNRSEAIQTLQSAAACQERSMIRNNEYNANTCAGTSDNGHYTITFVLSNANQSYVATATPQGVQTKDNCGTLTLDDTGIKAAAGQSGEFARTCWAGKHVVSSS